jgi:hypothetical protein
MSNQNSTSESNVLTTDKEQYNEHLTKFIDQLKSFFVNNNVQENLTKFESLDNDTKYNKGMAFVDLFDNELFDSFIQSKIRVFSHKEENTRLISEHLFGSELTLKMILNKQSDEVKKTIWNYLHTYFLTAILLKPEKEQNKLFLSKLYRLLQKPDTSSKKSLHGRIHDMFNEDINDATREMIDDIIGSFEKLLDKSNANANPMAGIMEISQKISSKYSAKIANGEIEMDKLIDSMKDKVPGMDVMLNSLKSMNTKQAKKEERVIIDDNFSTASVELGKEDNSTSSLNIGKMLKMADGFGVLPGFKGNKDSKANKVMENMFDKDGMPDLSKLSSMAKNTPGMDGISDMMQFVEKMQNAKTDEDSENVKKEMDEFMKSKLGFDMSSFMENMEPK